MIFDDGPPLTEAGELLTMAITFVVGVAFIAALSWKTNAEMKESASEEA